MVTTKQEKRKRKKTKSRRPRPPPPVGLAGRALKRADPTRLLLEQQQVGTLIKNHRTAGGEINQPAYNAYYDTVAARSIANRINRPDVYEMEGLRARRYIRDILVPRGHGGARATSQPIIPGPDRTPMEADLRDAHRDAAGIAQSFDETVNREVEDYKSDDSTLNELEANAQVLNASERLRRAAEDAEERGSLINLGESSQPQTQPGSPQPRQSNPTSVVQVTPTQSTERTGIESEMPTPSTFSPFQTDLSRISERWSDDDEGDYDDEGEEEKDPEPDDGTYELYEVEPDNEVTENVGDNESYTPAPTFTDVMSNMRNLTQTLNQLQGRVADLNASN